MSTNPSLAGGERPSQLIDLALQGGGSHGAFTWGVLDRLLEESWLTIEAISGTSAGAMNAAVMADGHARDGNQGARKALEAFWRKVSEAAAFSPLQRSPLDVLLGRWSLDHSPAYLAFDMMARVFSPYDLAFGAPNPLTKVLSESIDFARLAAAPIKLFITATNVRTGRPRVFRNAELSPDVLLASACLPAMFQAVEIDGEAYWDGGYSGNPTMTPLIQECVSDDTILVAINLDPTQEQAGWIDLNLKQLAIPHNENFEIEDLLTGVHYQWHDRSNYVALRPDVMPAHIFRLIRPSSSGTTLDANKTGPATKTKPEENE